MGMDTEQASELVIRGRHLSGLDGLRALAVMGVVAYHLGLSEVSGGFLGVDLFFVLSGFLITSLLVEEKITTSTIALGAFWGRRARRLLPALFAMLIVVIAYVAIVGRFSLLSGSNVDLSTLQADAVSTVFYVANWHLIAAHQSYFALFSLPSPIQHTWSLAIEEQFYIVFPFLVVALLAWRRRGQRVAAVVLLGAMALASAAEMALLFRHGADPSRIYYGTDTRAFDLLIGATLGFATAGRGIRSARLGRLLEIASWPAAILLALLWSIAGTTNAMPREFMYRGGFLLCALLAAVLIATAALRPRSSIARVLSIKPLVAVGIVSYGVYLWHWPVIVLINQQSTGLSTVPLDLVRIGLIAALTIVSYFALERPIRRHRFTRPQADATISAAFIVTLVVIFIGTSTLVATPPTDHVATYPVTGVGPNHRIPGSGGFDGQAPIALGRTPSAERPLRVTFVGDSLMAESQGGIAAAFDATGMIISTSMAAPGWGLTRASVHPIQSLSQSKGLSRPDVVIATWGWDNHEAATHPQAYQRLLHRAVKTLITGRDAAQGVMLLTYPTIGPMPYYYPQNIRQNAGSTKNALAWDQAAIAVARSFPGRVMVLPISDSVLLPERTYTTWLPPGNHHEAPYRSWVRVRKTDGVHLCQNGTIRYATALLADLQQLFGVGPARGSWWDGEWTDDPGYNHASLSSTCPVDHPPQRSSVTAPALPSN
ncbi:MAG: acyltransferase family protein [Actinomycetes bacterium]